MTQILPLTVFDRHEFPMEVAPVRMSDVVDVRVGGEVGSGVSGD